MNQNYFAPAFEFGNGYIHISDSVICSNMEIIDTMVRKEQKYNMNKVFALKINIVKIEGNFIFSPSVKYEIITEGTAKKVGKLKEINGDFIFVDI